MNTTVTLATGTTTLVSVHLFRAPGPGPHRWRTTVSSTADNAVDTRTGPSRDRTHYLYVAVIAAMVAGIAVGAIWPEFGKELKPLGTMFVNLIKMMITPIIFCTIVLGIGSVRRAAQVGRVGGLALGYFLTMSTVALAIGLVVGNIIKPGAGLHLRDIVVDRVARHEAWQEECDSDTDEQDQQVAHQALPDILS